MATISRQAEIEERYRIEIRAIWPARAVSEEIIGKATGKFTAHSVPWSTHLQLSYTLVRGLFVPLKKIVAIFFFKDFRGKFFTFKYLHPFGVYNSHFKIPIIR